MIDCLSKVCEHYESCAVLNHHYVKVICSVLSKNLFHKKGGQISNVLYIAAILIVALFISRNPWKIVPLYLPGTSEIFCRGNNQLLPVQLRWMARIYPAFQGISKAVCRFVNLNKFFSRLRFLLPCTLRSQRSPLIAGLRNQRNQTLNEWSWIYNHFCRRQPYGTSWNRIGWKLWTPRI